MEEIKIKEISKGEAATIHEELVDFNPERCLACGNENNIVQRFFLITYGDEEIAPFV
ncbi:hypothetical protein J4456_05325 [Candidatus Pacearchaeota archaeon]|nr:hypothetical protein [Candidatus Pacearchaeota archaeon]